MDLCRCGCLLTGSLHTRAQCPAGAPRAGVCAAEEVGPSGGLGFKGGVGRKNIPGGKSWPIGVTLRTHNTGGDLIPLFPGHPDNLAEASGHQAWGSGCAERRGEPRELQMKGARLTEQTRG